MILGVVFAAIDLAPSLSHMRIAILSGPQDGRDYALASRLRKQAQQRHGQVANVATDGDAENLQRAIDTKGRDALFALVLDGLDYPSPDQLELAARLPKRATIYILGPDADKLHFIRDLNGLRIGIGPHGGGTALLVREIFKSRHLAEVKPTLSEQGFGEQVELLKAGALDLGFFIMDEDAPLIERAVRDGLQIVDFDNAEVLTRQLPALKITTLYAGHFDAMKLLPPVNRKLYQVDRLVLCHRGSSRSATTALLVLVNAAFKGFIDYNRITPNDTGLLESPALARFVHDNGPSLLDQYAPRLVDFMPPANLLHYLVVVSLLLNATVVWHRFRLWRIDAKRLKLEERTLRLFGEHLTMAEIERLQPLPGQFSAADLAVFDDIIEQTAALRRWVRKLSLSMVAPMGAEMLYRYQESLIHHKLAVLHAFRDRLRALGGTEADLEQAGV
ncbi:hypothetical protein [uncultured Thiodictyon sp.]|uniref:hypothetical protein n=1 Tax=uncultured Thiodictyon sp. TaxID=1846217 RepID=UPI0025EDEEF7|nr:hypothetical protein [uncultured Thiodictyon sp.]